MQRTGSISHKVAFGTHIGLTHEKNQDAGGAWTWTLPDGMPASLTVVADGVSSGRDSEIASRMAVQAIYGRIAPRLESGESSLDALLQVVVEASEHVSDDIANLPNGRSTAADATTLVAAVCIGNEVAGAWCGDSRVFAISGEQVSRLTQDHSWAEEAARRGIMPIESAMRDPRAHMITRWLGPQDQTPDIETFHYSLSSSGILLCCSDGLYGYFSAPDYEEAEMTAPINETSPDLQAGINQLVALALERGGHDDITAAAIQVVEPIS